MVDKAFMCPFTPDDVFNGFMRKARLIECECERTTITSDRAMNYTYKWDTLRPEMLEEHDIPREKESKMRFMKRKRRIWRKRRRAALVTVYPNLPTNWEASAWSTARDRELNEIEREREKRVTKSLKELLDQHSDGEWHYYPPSKAIQGKRIDISELENLFTPPETSSYRFHETKTHALITITHAAISLSIFTFDKAKSNTIYLGKSFTITDLTALSSHERDALCALRGGGMQTKQKEAESPENPEEDDDLVSMLLIQRHRATVRKVMSDDGFLKGDILDEIVMDVSATFYYVTCDKLLRIQRCMRDHVKEAGDHEILDRAVTPNFHAHLSEKGVPQARIGQLRDTINPRSALDPMLDEESLPIVPS
ncbi:hypothetical protein ADUPG1_011476, partial [Aduncisulcus paluster]